MGRVKRQADESALWLDAADFENFGEWQLDTQFTHLMGSAYLLACKSPGVPVQDAGTRFTLAKAGCYRVWVRTKNWYYPASPGTFRIQVDELQPSPVLGALPSHDWHWQIAGDYDLAAGSHRLAVQDESGYFGRFAAIYFTTDLDHVPPRVTEDFEAFRARVKGMSLVPQDGGVFDLVVAGGGPGGVPAALAAARAGLRVLMLTNRPVLGGNAGADAGVNFNGAAARQPNAREGGIAEELMRTAAHFGCSMTEAMERLCQAESGLTVVYKQHVCAVEMAGQKITAVIARDVIKGSRYRYQGTCFVDATGDAWLTHLSGAKYRIGREARHQHEEAFAPETADLLTMSGCITNSVFLDTGAPVEWQAPDWVPRLPAGRAFGRNIERIGPSWWTEAPNDLDDIYDAELSRDELFRVMLAYFHYLKNLWEEKERAASYVFGRMPYFDAKRESRRMIGDYILTQSDCVEGRLFEDVIAHSGWPIDLHHPRGIYSGHEGPFFSNSHVPLVSIPYRCLYSVNIENLFASGRNLSVSHVALGTTRLQSTIAAVAQAVGTAAAMCVQRGMLPRALGQEHITDLQQRLLRDDAFLFDLENQDPTDLARTAEVCASSVAHDEVWWPNLGIPGELLPLDRSRATFLARGVEEEIPALYLLLTNHTAEPLPVTIHVRLQADPDGFTTEEDTAVATATVAPGEHWTCFPMSIKTSLRYLWVWLEETSGLSWRVQKFPPLDWTRSERQTSAVKFRNIRWESHCIALVEPDIRPANCSTQNVINGYSRIRDHERYAWVSASEEGLPQWLELDWRQKHTVSTIHLTFDSDMNNPALPIQVPALPETLVTAYTIEGFDGENWHTLAEVSGNYLRKRVHRFASQTLAKVRITIHGSGDGKTARLFEVRAYS
ncbi:MAG: FAD-dependent oxidoreductase [Clostridia bacterium]|nr:FAD-dependent oxidoreductase [Clostridia bacterium]